MISDVSDHAFEAAERLAPTPQERTTPGGTAAVWRIHYAALALAATVACHDRLPPSGSAPQPGSRPELGYLGLVADAATAAAVALGEGSGDPGATIFDLTYELGALNNEPYEHLLSVLDEAGINPADIDPRLSPADFSSPSRATGVPH